VLPLALLVVGSIASPALAHGDCSTDADCESGEICFEEACAAPCQTDDDCSDDQVCADAKACQHAGEHDEGCSSARAASSAAGLHTFGLVAAAAVALRFLRRRQE
jgi:hypothetical protein